MPPKIEPAPLSTFAKPPPDKYATIRTGGKYDKTHKHAQQIEQEENANNQQQQQHHQQHQQHQQIGGTLDRKPVSGVRKSNMTSLQRPIPEKTANGTSIVHQPLPEPPSLAPQPLSAAHFTQYRSPAPPVLPCCNQANQSQYRSQNRTGRTPEKFFSTSTQQQIKPGDQSRGGTRPSYSHTLDRRHAHAVQNSQMNQNAQNLRSGSQTLDRRSRQPTNARATPLVPLDSHQGSDNKDMYAVTEL